MANQIGTHYNTISLWESGTVPGAWYSLVQYLQMLEDPDELIQAIAQDGRSAEQSNDLA